MSDDTKPPEGYDSWLDFEVGPWPNEDSADIAHGIYRARAELAALRKERDEAVQRHNSLDNQRETLFERIAVLKAELAALRDDHDVRERYIRDARDAWSRWAEVLRVERDTLRARVQELEQREEWLFAACTIEELDRRTGLLTDYYYAANATEEHAALDEFHRAASGKETT